MDRRQFVTGLALTPLAQMTPVLANAVLPAAGSVEAATGNRAALFFRLEEALRDASALDLSGLDPSDRRHGWRERVREAAQHLAAFR